MNNYKKTIGTGILLGLVAGVAWAASRRYVSSSPRLINWDQVRRIAIATCKQSAVGYPFSRGTLTASFTEMVQQAEGPIAAYTRRELPQPLRSIHVFDRIEWIDANIANFRLLFEPFERLNEQAHEQSSTGARIVGGFNQMVLSGQMGLLMGYLAQRVLGQYDLSLLGREPITAGRLYFVEPNIRELQQGLGLDPKEFRMWIALHETTHAYEFEATAWLRGHMNSLLNRYFKTISADFMNVHSSQSGLRTLAGRIGTNLFRSGNVLELMMTREQRHIFHQLQALMSLLEGYSNHVMDQVGRSLLPSYEHLKERFEERVKNKSVGERLFAKLTGLDVKMEQYTLGERFVSEVARRRGIEFVNLAWESSLSLPTLDEVREPARWIKRMERMAVA
ncbi:MAG: zinc-dependent metalloprotease [Chloroflexi bacterium]|nr:zinc-dependent metalloprotease [Chloroflexota bacterium]